MTYNVLATGSDGNAVIVRGDVLIDCGVPFKTLLPVLPALHLVLLTHEHSDHFKPSTVSALHRERPGVRFGCCEWMLTKLLACGVSPRQIDVYDLDTDNDFLYSDLGVIVRPEKLQHNVPNCGYHITAGHERCFYATDTGTLDGIDAEGYELYLVEANHSREELEARAAEKAARGEFAYETAAARNHLSREAAAEWIARNCGPRSVWVPLHEHKTKGEKENGT